MSAETTLSGPDLSHGIAMSELADGSQLLGHATDKPVLLIKHGQEMFAIKTTCTHYNGPLTEKLIVDDTVHCP